MDPANCTHDLDFLLNGVARATNDIRDENVRLKTEIERLEKQLSEVIPELESLRKEGAVLKAAVRALVLQSGVLPPQNSHKPAIFARLPCEILAAIFNYAAAEPTHQFDPSIQAGSYGPWLQLICMKKSFPLICCASFWPGVAVLYRDIVLRRMGQVSALAETLRTPNTGARLRTLIKSIRWDSCVVAAPCSHVIREDLEFIFGNCTQLKSFSYHPHIGFPMRCQPPDGDECEGFFNPLWFVMTQPPRSDLPLLNGSAVSNLRSLDLSINLRKVQLDDASAMFLAIHGILSTCKTLESLTLGPWPSVLSTSLREELKDIPSVSLPSLTELQIFEPSSDMDTYLRSSWAAPQLSRLTILISTNWSPMRLLEYLGSHLRYLHLCPLRTLNVPIPDISLPRSGSLIINSPTLTYFDFWTVPYGCKSYQTRHDCEAYRLWTVDARSNVPSLRTVRVIFTALPRVLAPAVKSATCNPDWPSICHPRLLEEDAKDGVLYHRFPLGWVVQTEAAIMPQDLWEKCWTGRNPTGEWPGVYGSDITEMVRTMNEADCEDIERREAEREARLGGEESGLTDSDSECSGDDLDSDSGEEGDGDESPDEHDTDAMSEVVEGTSGSEELQDEQTLHEGLTGEQPQQVAGEQAGRDEETNHMEPGVVAESVSSDSEDPPPPLDRATILDAFRRTRDRESYHHVIPWDQ